MAWLVLPTLLLFAVFFALLMGVMAVVADALLLMAVLAPLLTGVVVRTYAWMTLLSDQGVIDSVLAGLVPFMVLTLTGVIARIDPRLEEAARSLGADDGVILAG